MSGSFHIFAPAKINLFLHITGRREDGYHTLQSLMAFASVGDDLEFFAENKFKVGVTGPFATGLPLSTDNLVYKAAQLLADQYQVPLSGKITLTKNLPIASGIGGGSTDAAATLKGLVKLWGLPNDPARLQKIAVQLGADVPACLHAETVWAEGIGEKLTPMQGLEALHLVLVNPLIATATPAVFKNFRRDFSTFIDAKCTIVADLKECRNDLTEAATIVTPEIRIVLDAIGNTKHCLLHRLSGSGATCFGIYESAEAANVAATTLKEKHPTWWAVSAETI